MRQGIRGLLVTFVFASIFLDLTSAVDRNKFKTCEKSSFCKRNRKVLENPTSYTLSSLEHSTNALNGRINTEYVSLPLEITALKEDIVHMKVWEDSPDRYPGPQDLLLQQTQIPIEPVEGSQNIYKVGDHITFTVQSSPFGLDLEYDGTKLLSVNNRRLFSFEHHRTKDNDTVPKEIVKPDAVKPETWDDEADGVWEPPMIPNPELEGRWEETFETHKDSKPFGPESVGLDFRFVGSKHVYGIPEHATSMALKPTKGEGINSDPYRLYNFDVFEYELNNPMALYGSIPLMISHTKTHTVGVFWFNSAETWVDVTEDKDGMDTHWFSESGIIDVFFLLGATPADVFRKYAALTGTTDLPPIFSIAYHQCKWNYRSEAEVAEVDEGFDTHNIPYDVIWLDIEHTDGKRYFTWDKNNFPTPKVMQEKIKEKGRKMVTIVDPHIKRDPGYIVHKLAQSEGIYVKDRDDKEYDGHCWPGSSSWIDYVDPRAREWWAGRFSYDNYEGSTDILYTWNDMNEPSVFNGPEVTMHKDAKHIDGWEHRDVHNAYGLYMQMATAQGLIRRTTTANERPFVLSRAFFAGTQRYGAVWTGDNAGNWDHLAISQPMLLTLGLTGLSFAGADVGGFFGNPDSELLTRWYQAGAFQPFFRAHAHLDSKRREPWLLGDPWMSIIRETIRIRYSLLPYWYTTFYQNYLTGMPVMRPLWVEFPEDESTFAEDSQHLVGAGLLVKPVTQSKQTSTTVYLPGKEPWYDFYTAQKYNGGQNVEVSTPLERIAVFYRGGHIIPRMMRPRRSSAHMVDDPYTLYVALDSEGKAQGELYIDDGHSFSYKKGDFLRRNFTFDNNKLESVAIGTEKFPATNVIERIVILGWSSAPSKVVLNAAGATEKELDFVFENGVLTLRKPDVLIRRDWSITIA